MVCALNGMVVSSRTGVAHCFIRVGEKCRLLGQKVQFTGLRDLIRNSCLLNGGRCGKMPECIGFDLISQCNTQLTLIVCCERGADIRNCVHPYITVYEATESISTAISSA